MSTSQILFEIWLQTDQGKFVFLKEYEHQELANLYQQYATRFFEIYPGYGIESVFVRKAGESIYLIGYYESGSRKLIMEGEFFMSQEEAEQITREYHQADGQEWVWQSHHLEDDDVLDELEIEGL